MKSKTMSKNNFCEMLPKQKIRVQTGQEISFIFHSKQGTRDGTIEKQYYKIIIIVDMTSNLEISNIITNQFFYILEIFMFDALAF